MGRMKKLFTSLFLLLTILLLCSGCSAETVSQGGSQSAAAQQNNPADTDAGFSGEYPAYTGQPYAAVNGNVPGFEEDELTAASFERYSELDSLGRCGAAAPLTPAWAWILCQRASAGTSAVSIPPDGTAYSITLLMEKICTTAAISSAISFPARTPTKKT